MGFIPSIRLNENLAIANIGVWPEALMDGRVALVCKMPETAIKALHRGAKCSFLLAVIRVELLALLCLGLRVNDEPQHPFTALMLNSATEDAPLLGQILTSGSTTLHCLNELNHPMLSASCSLEGPAATAAAEALRSSDYWLLTPESMRLFKPPDLSRMFELALDRFGREIFRPSHQPFGEEIMMFANIPLTLDIWKPTEIFEVTPTIGDGPFLIGDQDEGPKFERLIQLLIDQAYPGRSYRSPQVQDGKSTRELTDLLAFDERSICVIQAKALSVLSVEFDRPSSRRAASVTKDIEKALKQLVGAMNKIRSDAPLFTADGRPLAIPNRKESLANAIVLLSEMYAFVDWTKIAADVIAASESESRKALFHVMDLRELSALTARCPDSWTFFSRISQRWIQIKIKGTSYMRTIVPIRGED
jgi:hypothetical protein